MVDCRSGWPDDFCPANSSSKDGCKRYTLLPESPNWLEVRRQLVKEMFGEDRLPSDDKPSVPPVTHMVNYRFPSCMSSIWGSAPSSDCEKTVPITEIVWQTTARLNASYAMNITSKAFLSFNSSGWAPHGFIWGAQQPAHPEPPRPGKTLVIFHRGHGRGDDCPTFGDNDGTTDWLNQLGLDVVTMMMPFRDCNTQQEQPFSGHAWFEHFEKQQVPWLRFFLEPVIKTINYAMNTLGYERILMAGLSGGGWTTTLAAAVDPRIELSVPIAGSLPCDFRKKSFDFEQFCDSQWARIGNYTALYVLASLEKHRSSLQVLHEADPCCFHGCGRHNRIEEYGRFVRASSQGLFQTVVTEGNRHEVNVRDKILIGNLFYQMAHGHHGQLNLSSPLNLLERSSISGFTEPDEIPGEGPSQVPQPPRPLPQTGVAEGPVPLWSLPVASAVGLLLGMVVMFAWNRAKRTHAAYVASAWLGPGDLYGAECSEPENHS
ncbi:unnamed protein product [Durusdinium trenchii]|uniref:Feruloyl esterase n=1 Tax=Durusdinium trenchii TaxID=1381693 RepID=A0ABP0J173_9DINO